MIQPALSFTSNCLNQFIQNKFGLKETKVTINNLSDPDGSIPSKNQNKLILSLINVSKESTRPFYNSNQSKSNSNYVNKSKTERYNLHLLLSSNFDNYDESLKFLNAGIGFFQLYAKIDKTNFSRIPEGCEKIEFEMENLDFHQVHSLWTSMGTKYQPSVIYKMWLISIQTDQIEGFVSAVNSYQAKTLIS